MPSKDLKTGTLKEILMSRSEMRLKETHLHLVGRAMAHKQLFYFANPDLQIDPKDLC